MAIRLYGPNGEVIRQPEAGEWAVWKRDIDRVLREIFSILPNPDPILRRTGKRIEVYREVKRDTHVWSVVQSRKRGVLSKPWDIIPGGDAGIDKEAADFVKGNLEEIDFYQDLSQMLEAIVYGYSVMEIIWEERDGKWWIKELKGRKPEKFGFDREGGLRLKTVGKLEGEEVPPFKFVVVQHEVEEDENPYGTALMSIVYWPWFFKKMDWKFWAIALERGGMPLLIGQYPAGTSESEKDEFFEFLKNAVQDAVIMMNERFKLDSIDISGKIETIYERMIRVANAEISKAILGQTLTTEIGEKGSYAAAKEHMNVRQDIIESDAKMLMSAVQRQLILPLVLFNFEVERLPRFVIDYQEEDVRLEFARRDQILQSMGYPITKEYISEKYGVPMPREDEEVLVPEGKGVAFEAEGKGVEVEFSEEDKRVLARADSLDVFYKKAVELGKKRYKEVTDWFIERVKRFKKEGDIYNLVEVLRDIPWDGLADLKRNVDFVAYLMGKADVQEDIGKGINFEVYAPEPVGFTEAIEYFRRKVPMTPDMIEEMMGVYDELYYKYFTLSGFESIEFIARVKHELYKALREGLTLKDFQGSVEGIFERAGVTGNVPWRIETVFRTNIQGAYHAGMWDRLHDPDVKGFFPFYKYLTVGDDRVRPSHAAMHGKVFRADDPIWERWWPPNGFNCRCTVVPISKIEARGIKPHVPPGVEPDEGFAFNPGKVLRQLWSEGIDSGVYEWEDERIPGICEPEFGIKRWVRLIIPGSYEGCRPSIERDIDKIREFAQEFPGYWGYEGEMSKEAVRAYFRGKIGDEWIKTPVGLYIKLNADGLIDHAIETAGGIEQGVLRLKTYSLLRPTIENPYEIWLEIGKRRPHFALKFIGLFVDGESRPFLVITNITRRGILSYTAYRTRLKEIDMKRFGWLIYGK